MILIPLVGCDVWRFLLTVDFMWSQSLIQLFFISNGNILVKLILASTSQLVYGRLEVRPVGFVWRSLNFYIYIRKLLNYGFFVISAENLLSVKLVKVPESASECEYELNRKSQSLVKHSLQVWLEVSVGVIKSRISLQLTHNFKLICHKSHTILSTRNVTKPSFFGGKIKH